MLRTPIISRRAFLAAAAALMPAVAGREQQRPNVVLILADDLGYGDLGCYGSSIRTPNLDNIASEGVLFRHFYSASPVCSPSRAALMTGRYPTRVGIPSVLWPADQRGLPDTEMTIATVLKQRGYRTMCVGKWHLGSQPQYLPTSRGFDEYFGLPYSNDMWPRPLLYNTTVVEEPARLDTLTQRYTEQAVQFINENKDRAFFLYLAHNAPHVPLGCSERFHGSSRLGMYGDVVQELDWSVGQVLQAIQANGLNESTLVMFSSDNGPRYQGQVGRPRGRKGSTYEGGMREPFIARFPGLIPAGLVTDGVATTMDILPTVAGLCGASLPAKPLDGMDISPLLTGASPDLDREVFLYFDGWKVQAARLGKWKLHLTRYNSPAWGPEPVGGRINLPLPAPELYDLIEDQESYDVAAANQEIVADIRARVEALLPTFPSEVGDAWRDTMNIQVQNTPSGALPVRASTG